MDPTDIAALLAQINATYVFSVLAIGDCPMARSGVTHCDIACPSRLAAADRQLLE